MPFLRDTYAAGNGDCAGVLRINTDRGVIAAVVRGDRDRLKSKGIPVDIVYDQAR